MKWVEPGAIEEVTIEDVTFSLRVLTASRAQRLAEFNTSDNQIRDMLRLGLAGWTGDGAPPFDVDDNGEPTIETIERLPFHVAREIMDAFVSLNRLREEDEGN